MKVQIPGNTPMERLANITKKVVHVSKADVERDEQRRRKRVRQRRKRK